MVSYMKKMIWGDPAQQQAAAEESKHDEDNSGATFTGNVSPDQIMKQGWLFKRSRYL